jgi:hypothetical protein
MAVTLVFAYVFALLFGTVIGVSQTNVQLLQDVALIAIGAVFGSAVGVNGWKQSVSALHTRLDQLGVPPAGTTVEVVPAPLPQNTDTSTPAGN